MMNAFPASSLSIVLAAALWASPDTECVRASGCITLPGGGLVACTAEACSASGGAFLAGAFAPDTNTTRTIFLDGRTKQPERSPGERLLLAVENGIVYVIDTDTAAPIGHFQKRSPSVTIEPRNGRADIVYHIMALPQPGERPMRPGPPVKRIIRYTNGIYAPLH